MGNFVEIAETKGYEWQRFQLRFAKETNLECAARHLDAINQDGNIIYGMVMK